MPGGCLMAGSDRGPSDNPLRGSCLLLSPGLPSAPEVRSRRCMVLRVTDPLRPGDPVELGGYRLLGRLGQGGMGSVFLGRGPAGRLVAVKVIRAEYAYEPEFRARFRSEVNRAREVPPFCTAE